MSCSRTVRAHSLYMAMFARLFDRAVDGVLFMDHVLVTLLIAIRRRGANAGMVSKMVVLMLKIVFKLSQLNYVPFGNTSSNK